MQATTARKSATAPPARRTRRAGFTLTEIMISLGVLVVGMSMAAAALHAGIQNHRTTVDDIVRTLIGENAVAIARVRLEDGSLNTSPRLLTDDDIGPGDRRYPVQRPTNYSYIIYGWRVSSDQNDYKFLVIPARYKDPDNRLKTVSLNRVSISNPATLDVSQLVARHGGAEHLVPGARVIREIYDGSEFKTIDVMTITAKKGRSGALLNKRLPDTDIGTCDVKVLRLEGGDSDDMAETTTWYRGRGALEATASSTLPGG